MAELLVHPYRLANEPLLNQYYGLLSSFPNLNWVAPDLAIADVSARLRTQHGLRLPDALQVATAIQAGAGAILTNDAAFARVPAIEVGTLTGLAQP
jgi:predicted nucleic acid-binding protein